MPVAMTTSSETYDVKKHTQVGIPSDDGCIRISKQKRTRDLRQRGPFLRLFKGLSVKLPYQSLS